MVGAIFPLRELLKALDWVSSVSVFIGFVLGKSVGRPRPQWVKGHNCMILILGD
jgi:hypothetical protein